MKSIEIPKLIFSKWYSWENRFEFPEKEYPGIYLIAATRKQLEGNKVLLEDVNYVGMTNQKKGLIGRWGNFNSAIKGKKGIHSGGYSFFKDLGHYDEWSKKLFVSALSLNFDHLILSPNTLQNKGKIAYLEYEVLSKIYKKTKRLPKHNTLG